MDNASESEPIHCQLCGRTRGSFMATATGWACLGHLPKIGRRLNRDHRA